MLMPVLLSRSDRVGTEYSNHNSHASHIANLDPQQMPSTNDPSQWLAAVVVHSVGYLLVSLLIALLVYEKLGLSLLRRAWFNVDVVWMIALMISGVALMII